MKRINIYCYLEIFISLILVLLSCSSEQTTKNIKINNKILNNEKSIEIKYIIPRSGLRLRKKPTLKSKIIKVIPFNSPVKILKRTPKTVIIDSINSHWAFVEYNQKRRKAKKFSGWIFEGYLAHRKKELTNVITVNIDTYPGEAIPPITVYAYNIKKKKKIKIKDTTGGICVFSTKLPNGKYYIYVDGGYYYTKQKKSCEQDFNNIKPYGDHCVEPEVISIPRDIYEHTDIKIDWYNPLAIIY